MILVIVSAVATLFELKRYDYSDACDFFNLCFLLMWIASLALCRVHCCSHVTLDNENIPLEKYFCPICCCSCIEYWNLGYRFWYQCMQQDQPEEHKNKNENKNVQPHDGNHRNNKTDDCECCVCCACCCCFNVMIYYFYPKDDSKRVITVLHVMLFVYQVSYAQIYSVNDGDGVIWRICYLASYLILIIVCAAYDLIPKKDGTNSKLEKLKQFDIKRAFLFLLCQKILGVLQICVSIVFFVLDVKEDDYNYYDVLYQATYWLYPIFLLSNEINQFFANIEYTLIIRGLASKQLQASVESHAGNHTSNNSIDTKDSELQRYLGSHSSVESRNTKCKIINISNIYVVLSLATAGCIVSIYCGIATLTGDVEWYFWFVNSKAAAVFLNIVIPSLYIACCAGFIISLYF